MGIDPKLLTAQRADYLEKNLNRTPLFFLFMLHEVLIKWLVRFFDYFFRFAYESTAPVYDQRSSWTGIVLRILSPKEIAKAPNQRITTLRR